MKSAAALMIILLTAVDVAELTSGCRLAAVGVTEFPFTSLGTTAVAAPLSEQRIVEGDTEGFIMMSVVRPEAVAAPTSLLTLIVVPAGPVGNSCWMGKAADKATAGSELSIISWVIAAAVFGTTSNREGAVTLVGVPSTFVDLVKSVINLSTLATETALAISAISTAAATAATSMGVAVLGGFQSLKLLDGK
uniref:Uncharacterized protein n=1 Tax=Glossina pallidipes TaxID=7398 RepID=A0A1A9ZF42_GLOPL